MKRVTMAILAVVLIIAISAVLANQGMATNDDGKITVISTIFPPYDFVREITGTAEGAVDSAISVENKLLLPPGSESHTYEPSPRDIISLQKCDIFIYSGGESEKWVDRILEVTDTGNMIVISLMDCVSPVEEELVEGMQNDEALANENVQKSVEDSAQNSTQESVPQYDEHVWTSPENAKLIAERIRDALCEADSENSDIYIENTQIFLDKLDGLDTAFEAVMEGAVRDTVVFGDRFPFRYLTDAYGILYFAAFPGCAGESEASAATVAFLIDKVRDENIPVVFYNELSNEKIADTICQATGARKLPLYACHNLSKVDFDNGVGYIELMTRNIGNLKEALWH